MDVQETKVHRAAKTVLAMGILLLVFFVQGAAAVVSSLDGIESVVIRGLILWGLALGTAAFYGLKYGTLDVLGFHRPDSLSYRRLYYFVPLILVAAINFSWGIDGKSGIGMVFANLLLTLGIGLCEEIYFRGIICRVWMKTGEGTAVAVSSVLFAICHLMNLAGGAGIVETILQVCFAFVYGIVFALIFIIGHSIWPCIILHAFHDFSSFIGAEGSRSEAAVVGGVQFVILLCYALIIMRERQKGLPSQRNIAE